MKEPLPTVAAPVPQQTAVVQPRTHVNSAMTTAYVPKSPSSTRTGADDHKRYTTKGSPT
ncbi:hypothetical protein [Pseudorhodoferax sp.]|uniref:hypothetical protein n=1 Tax=Pseudorhodoferax sp. TaxID=1993553 RepID=UPI002DD65592|nr:hypothetical protein [Pseudorhodoferax sp.]